MPHIGGSVGISFITTLLAYVDVIWIMAGCTTLLIPIPFLMRRPKRATPVPIGH